jgi:hypothetical protein
MTIPFHPASSVAAKDKEEQISTGYAISRVVTDIKAREAKLSS